MAGIVLPRLTNTVDCGPIGYPGIVVEFWLNPPIHEDNASGADDPWETVFYRQMAYIIERVRISGDYTEDGEELVLEVQDAKALWDLEHRGDFDSQILTWTWGQHSRDRNERLQTERKNS